MNNDKLREILDELTLFWQTNKYPIVDKLNPGIDIVGKKLQHFSGILPNEVIELYQWKNGIRPEVTTDLIGRLQIFELGIFMPFDRVELMQNEMEGDELGWDANKLPLFESGGGEYLLVECDDSQDSYGRIYLHSIGAVDFNRIISLYDSLYTLFLSILENYKNGIYTFDSDGFLKIDYEQSYQLMKKLNPDSAYWKLF